MISPSGFLRYFLILFVHRGVVKAARQRVRSLFRIRFPLRFGLPVRLDDLRILRTSLVVSGQKRHRKADQDQNADHDEQELAASLAIYRLLAKRTGYTPPWGMLTGVRPSKLMISLMREYGEDGAIRYFTDRLLVQPDKALLAAAVAMQEDRILRTSKPDSFSLYLSVPFCPSRCSYCSFVSHSVNSPSAKKLVDPYVALLLREIAQCGAIAHELGLRLETVYIGGGTPTTLSAEQLSAVCGSLARHFPLQTAREFTVEAGRPDTITAEKLRALKDAGVTRISINPQTLNDDVLEHIGRRHTAADAIETYRLAREMGFDNINMDLIAGLETDTPQSFRRTLDGIFELSPENITVHTLALKRSSRMVAVDNARAGRRRRRGNARRHTAVVYGRRIRAILYVSPKPFRRQL